MMVHVDESACERAIRVLNAVGGQEAKSVATQLLTAWVESLTQQINFNELPALCRPQAG